MKKRGSINSSLIWVILIFVIIIIAMIFFILKFQNINTTQTSVSQDALLSGASLSLEKGDRFIIDFAGLDYNFSINKINSSSVIIKTNKGEFFELSASSSLLGFDLDEDNIIDVLVSLIEINNKKVELYLEAPSINSDCAEDWNCTDWSPCLNYLKKRVCVDLNKCNLNEGYIDAEVCTSPNIKEYYYKSPASKKEASIINCGSGVGIFVNDCFVNASLTCSSAQFVNDISLDVFGVILKTQSLLKLKEVNEKCVLYEEAQEISIKYGENLISDLLAQGYSLAEIAEEEAAANEVIQNYLGAWTECFFAKEDLISVLEQWKQGNLTSTSDCSFNEQGEFGCQYLGDFEKAVCESGI